MKSNKKKQPQSGNQPVSLETPMSVQEALNSLSKKRMGGSINMRGIDFQILYASFLLLDNLSVQYDVSVMLEGIEDIDLSLPSGKQYIQIKSSQNPIDAGMFWNLNVLQNFWEVYRLDKHAQFRLVHNTIIAKGKLEEFGFSHISDETVQFWQGKLSSIDPVANRDLVQNFLQRITVSKATPGWLLKRITELLYDKFEINVDTELPYLKALFYHVFEWSKNKETVSYPELLLLIQSVTDSFSRFPVNPAIQNNWIEEVSYETSDYTLKSTYYDGKAARPEDIAKGLPIARPTWETSITKALQQFDVVVIKSSSGQGKSTLAWQVGLQLKESSTSIYQANNCASYNQAAAIADFIKTRLRIGQSPVVIIDGLNKKMEAWTDLADLLHDQPVKLLITTREEDWIRYDGDHSKIAIGTIDIQLSISEAADLYRELKRNGRVHPSVTDWEPAWERVKEKGLLIEFIFLLTQGQMIEERLSYQVQTLAKERDSGVKLETLRLIALADALNVRIPTSKLNEHLKPQLHGMDRNELYRQLEKEYYVRFQSNYVEGLHPVRSQHLIDILHSHISLEESLITLIEIIDDSYVYDYFISAPLLGVLSVDYYRATAARIAQKTLSEIVYAIDGLMHYEPYRYWKENRKVFDDVYQHGGLELFVSDTLPFTKFDAIQNLAETMTGDAAANMRYLLGRLNELSSYSIEKSSIFQFVKCLQAALDGKRFENAEGIAFLFKWFRKINVPFPNLIEIDERELLSGLKTKSIDESSELFHYYSLLSSQAYRQFATINKEDIIGWIKRKTNTLSIFEQDENVHIEYLLDNEDIDTQKLSIYRINILHAFFPFYKQYCTSVIVFPFPNEHIYEAVVQNGRKAISPKNLYDDFDIHINKIWSKTILSQYVASSTYAWQKEQFHLRETALAMVRNIVRLFEAHLERKQSKIRTQSNEAVRLINDFLTKDRTSKKYPPHSRKYFDEVPFDKELKEIADCYSSLRNFVNQMAGLFNRESDHDRHLAIVNLKSTMHRLPAMQRAFARICQSSHPYFVTLDLEIGEKEWYKRMVEIVLYYADQLKKRFPETIVVASKSAAQWNACDRQQKLDQVHQIVKKFSGESPYTFFLPKRIIEEELLSYGVIGIQGCDLRSEQDLWNLVSGLRHLASTNIHFFTLIFVSDEKKVIGAMRFNIDQFQSMQKVIDQEEYDEDAPSPPLMVFPDAVMLDVLEGITLYSTPEDETFPFYFKMINAIWQLSECRQRLNHENLVEGGWLKEIENEKQAAIQQQASTVYSSSSAKIFPNKAIVEEFLNKKRSFKKDELVQFLIDMSLTAQRF